MHLRPLTILVCAILPATATIPHMTREPAARDLDVGVPPGSPTSWGRRFPAITPPRDHMFAVTPRRVAKPDGKPGGQQRTVARPRTVEVDVRIASSFGVVRILTWDIENHLRWIHGEPQQPEGGAITGVSGRAGALPATSDSMYWASMGALLRFLLHPQLVSEKELIAHLVELGEPVLSVVDSAASERAIRKTCQRLKAMILAKRHPPAPLAGATPRETMLRRFLAAELVTAHPYDPEAGFGRRLFVFAVDLEASLLEYATHPDAFLRRNAVAALGRCRSVKAMEALADIAAQTPDPVVRMRALAAVGNFRSLRNRKPLLDRLAKTKDGVERVALIQALGRIGAREAVPSLLRLGRQGRRIDPDLLQAVMAALARIRDPASRSFVESVARAAKANPAAFSVDARGGPTPDRPDSKTARAEVIEQLAWIALVRIDPKNTHAAKRLLELVADPSDPAAGRRLRVRGRGGSYPGVSLRRVHPPVQILFLDVLSELGEDGVAGLRKIVTDRTVEPALRGHALSRLPYFEREEIAVELLGDRTSNAELKIYAFETLAGDASRSLKEIGFGLLDECRRSPGGGGSPEHRYLWLTTLRALGKRRLLKAENLLPLLQHARAASGGKEERDALRRLDRLVGRLVEAAVERTPISRLRGQIDEAIELVVKHGLSRRIAREDPAVVRKYVEGQLAGLKGRKGDTRYKNMVAHAILSHLGGGRPLSARERAAFEPVVQLEEEILLALGRTRSSEAAKALIDFLRDGPRNPYRAHACLALGISGQKAFAPDLVPVLLDGDGFVRFCAYESLRHLTGQDYWADWMYGDNRVRFAAADRYRASLAARR